MVRVYENVSVFENTEDYVRYLERRVELLELRVKKCRMDSDLFDSHRSVNERSIEDWRMKG